MNKFLLCAVVLSLALHCICDEVPTPCPSEIYCHGPLLHTIQMAKIYEDSKLFVDMKMRFSPNETLTRFGEFMAKNNNYPSKLAVRLFVNETFEPAGQEFEDWDPEDWIKHPKYVDKIKDENFKDWALKLNLIWKDLGRKMTKDVKHNQDQYSIIWVPNPVIVPGGRFREFYYWDSYWIVQGLLLSEMKTTVKGMLENFLYIVDNYGHIPNGGRIYYMQRSQPPLMIPMIKLYYDHTNDFQFLKDNIHIMEKEFNFWITEHNRTVTLNGANYTLAAYGDYSKGPRPESYSEDVESASLFRDDERKEHFYSELKAAAESGWDFSSRWFITNATNKGNLTNSKIRSIIPVDLNALIYWNAVMLSEFNKNLGNTEKASYYQKIGQQWIEAVTAVLWHEEVGVWLDYDMSNSIKRDYFYPSNISPLLTGCYISTNKEKIVRLVLKYLQNQKITDWSGGIPATMEHTGEQWDYPNAWPPLQHMMVVGLRNTGDEIAERLAFQIVETWVRSNYKAFKETDAMFEKYDATVIGGHGTGGEYEMQLGFGWTNGIIMDFLNMYSSELSVTDPPPPPPKSVAATVTQPTMSRFSQISTVLIALMVSLAAGFIGVCIYKRRTSQQGDAKKIQQRPSRSHYTELRSMTKRAKGGR